jgi:hypothetical protein
LQLGGQVAYGPGTFKNEKWTKRQWRFSQQVADEFWCRWIRDYLPILTKRTKWFEEVEEVKCDDIVVIVDDTAPRNLWKKGRVVEVHPGIDNKVRSVTVRTATGTYKRPVAKIAVLKVGN